MARNSNTEAGVTRKAHGQSEWEEGQGRLKSEEDQSGSGSEEGEGDSEPEEDESHSESEEDQSHSQSEEDESYSERPSLKSNETQASGSKMHTTHPYNDPDAPVSYYMYLPNALQCLIGVEPAGLKWAFAETLSKLSSSRRESLTAKLRQLSNQSSNALHVRESLVGIEPPGLKMALADALSKLSSSRRESLITKLRTLHFSQNQIPRQSIVREFSEGAPRQTIERQFPYGDPRQDDTNSSSRHPTETSELPILNNELKSSIEGMVTKALSNKLKNRPRKHVKTKSDQNANRNKSELLSNFVLDDEYDEDVLSKEQQQRAPFSEKMTEKKKKTLLRGDDDCPTLERATCYRNAQKCRLHQNTSALFFAGVVVCAVAIAVIALLIGTISIGAEDAGNPQDQCYGWSGLKLCFHDGTRL